MNFHLMLGVNHRCFSNGLQRYGLFFILQIFLQLFSHFFATFLSKNHKTLYFNNLQNSDFLTKKGCIAADQKETALFQEERRLLIPNNNKA